MIAGSKSEIAWLRKLSSLSWPSERVSWCQLTAIGTCGEASFSYAAGQAKTWIALSTHLAKVMVASNACTWSLRAFFQASSPTFPPIPKSFLI